MNDAEARQRVLIALWPDQAGRQGAYCADGGKNRGTIGCCYIGVAAGHTSGAFPNTINYVSLDGLSYEI